MLVFRIQEVTYRGETAVEVVRALERDAAGYPDRGRSIRRFLRWSIGRLGDRVPPRERDLSGTLGDEELALSYLVLLDEYGAGEFSAGHREPTT